MIILFLALSIEVQSITYFILVQDEQMELFHLSLHISTGLLSLH